MGWGVFAAITEESRHGVQNAIFQRLKKTLCIDLQYIKIELFCRLKTALKFLILLPPWAKYNFYAVYQPSPYRYRSK